MNASDQPSLGVDGFSQHSLRLTVLRDHESLGTATGFVVLLETTGKPFLITNWHVVTGLHAESGNPIDEKTAAIPDALAIDHHRSDLFGRWIRVIQPLFDGSRPLWLEHPYGCGHAGGVDVVALPLDTRYGIVVKPLFPLLTQLPDHLTVASTVHVIGFPAGRGVAGQWPIWLTGHIASDPSLDFDRVPRFLIDARTRGGMSGSPVVVRTNRISMTGQGGPELEVHGQKLTQFLGVYSGRVRHDLDLGFVWRAQVVEEVLKGEIGPSSQARRFNAGVADDDNVVSGGADIIENASVIDFDSPQNPVDRK